ncbi:MAG: DUF6263 family protein [Cyanobacteriota bacterium]|nr:DUF6263 family protein [Cyanobacteriota bacterium]
MKKTLLVGALVGALVGSSTEPLTLSLRAQPLTPENFQSLEMAQAEMAAPEVILLDAGAQPRQELRFTPVPDTKQTITISMEMDMTLSVAGQEMPADSPGNAMTFELTVIDVADNGDIEYELYCTEVEVLGGDPEVRDAIEAQLQTFVGTGGNFTIDNRGQVRSANMDLPAGAAPELQQIFEQLTSSFEQLSTPLPQEAVGVGAQWNIVQAINVTEIDLTQNVTYELIGLDNNVATFDVTVEQYAEAQPIVTPGLPPGVTTTLDSMSSQGVGQMTMQFDRLMPVRSNLSMQTNSVTSVREAGTAEETVVNSTMVMQMDVESQ